MLFDLRDSLKKVGRLDLLEQPAQGALRYFSSLPETEMTPAALRLRGVTLGNIGDVFQAKGNLSQALAAYQATQAIIERLVQKDPANAEWQRDLSVGHNKIGAVRQAQGDLAGALAAYQAALAIIERLSQQDPTNAQWQRDLAMSLGNLSFALLFDRQFQEAIAAAEEALALDPNPAIATNQAHGYLLSGQFEKAETIYRQHARDKVNDRQTFAEAVLDDFAKLRQRGIDHPDMQKIEKLLRAEERPPP